MNKLVSVLLALTIAALCAVPLADAPIAGPSLSDGHQYTDAGGNDAEKSRERTMIIAHIANPDQAIDWEENIVLLTTYYFGCFRAKLPQDVSIADALPYEHVKVILREPATQFSEYYETLVNAVMIKGMEVMRGKLIAQTDAYIDIEIWTFTRDSEREGEIQRFILNEDSVFSRFVPIGDDVNVTYETDADGNAVALLIIGFSG